MSLIRVRIFKKSGMKNIIVIPTYNERDNLKVLLPRIFKLIPEVHVVVSDDSSPDGTGDLVKDLQKEYENLSIISRPKKMGLGRAYIDAFTEVIKDRDVKSVVMMDADLSHNPEYLEEMFSKADLYGVVVGSRYISGGKTVGWELWRRLLSFFGNLYCRLITSLPIHDCTSGFNVIDASLLRKIDMSKMDMSGYAFIMELKFLLFKAGANFTEVPITFVNRVGGESKISSHIISEGIIAPWKIRITK